MFVYITMFVSASVIHAQNITVYPSIRTLHFRGEIPMARVSFQAGMQCLDIRSSRDPGSHVALTIQQPCPSDLYNLL